MAVTIRLLGRPTIERDGTTVAGPRGHKAWGLLAYLARLVEATEDTRLPIYLYHFPAMTGVPWSIEVIAEALRRFPGRIAGLKDSSGDLPFSREVAALSAQMAVFPSNEATLMEARSGTFAGCISASVNVNADLSQQAFRSGDAATLEIEAGPQPEA